MAIFVQVVGGLVVVALIIRGAMAFYQDFTSRK